MRIAYLCADRGIPVFGVKGSSLHVQEVMRALQRQGAEIEVFAASTKGDVAEDLKNIRVHTIERVATTNRKIREQADCAANTAVISQLQRSGPFDLVYERYSLWSHAGMRHAQQTGTPGILEVNAPLIDEQDTYRGLIDRAAAERIARDCFQDARVLVAVSEGVASYLAGFPEAQGKIHVIPNGVNPVRFQGNSASTATTDNLFTIGFVGTLKPWHGLNDLLAAFSHLRTSFPGVRLLIVGDGPEAGNLKERIWNERLENVVELTGAVGPDEIPALLQRMDAGVAPYPDIPEFYFSPLKVYEYMAAGLAVVASRIGQLDGLITHEHNGLLYTPGDTRGLADRLAQLANNHCLGKRLGQAARQTILTSHSWDDRVADILRLAMSGTEQPPVRSTA